jgi:hypothetical protein
MPTNYHPQQSWSDVPSSLLDMFAGAGRGLVRGSLGMYGDLESLGRSGLNYLGVDVNPKTSLPTSEEMDKILPPFTPLVPHPNSTYPYDNLGVFGAPVGPIGVVSKGIKKLGGHIDSPTNLSRREFMKKAGAVGGAGVLGTTLVGKAGKYLDKVAPEVKATEEASPAIKAAKKYKFNSLKEYNDHLNDRAYDETDISFYENGKNYEHDRNAYDYYTEEMFPKYKKQFAQMDEARYARAKELSKETIYAKPDGEFYTKDGTWIPQNELESLDHFSPQAKADMKILKNSSGLHPKGTHWSDWLDWSDLK